MHTSLYCRAHFASSAAAFGDDDCLDPRVLALILEPKFNGIGLNLEI